MSLLDEILEQKRREIAEALAADHDPPTMRREPLDVPRLMKRPKGAPLRLIAEVKFRSPSAGHLSRALDAGARAEAYAKAGAHMVSVLCDARFFGGGFEDLSRARAALGRAPRDIPLLAKEFILDEVQLDLARMSGADAVLLIARITSPARLAELHRAARLRSLWPLVEVVTEAELDAAIACGAKLIGVNARDLDTLEIDTERTARLLAKIPEGSVAIHLSGLKSEKDIRAVAEGRADAALIGEALMREDDPSPLLQRLVLAGA